MHRHHTLSGNAASIYLPDKVTLALNVFIFNKCNGWWRRKCSFLEEDHGSHFVIDQHFTSTVGGSNRRRRSNVRVEFSVLGLQPHRSETFTLPKDPLLVEKVRDIVRLYLNPPEHAAVFLRARETRKSKRSIAPSHCCRCGPVRWSGGRTTTTGTARPRCLPRSTPRPVR
jgi:hypothetical protein